MSDQLRLEIKTPQQYQYVFFQHMDFYAQRNQLTKPGRKLDTKDVKVILDDVAEEIRQLYRVTESDHLVYKEMMRIILFGKDKGRKGNAR